MGVGFQAQGVGCRMLGSWVSGVVSAGVGRWMRALGAWVLEFRVNESSRNGNSHIGILTFGLHTNENSGNESSRTWNLRNENNKNSRKETSRNEIDQQV